MTPDKLARADPAPEEDWKQTLLQRWKPLQWLKFCGTAAFTAVFFQGYFQVLRHPSREPFDMPLTPLDSWVPFTPSAIWVYLSLWVYVGSAPALLPNLRDLLRYAAWAAALCSSGLLLFWWWPTAVPTELHRLDPAVLAHGLHGGFAVLRGVDAAGNACPSLHVATAVFTGIWVHRQLAAVGAPAWLRHLNLGWCAAIAWSTLAVRQHVVLDVLAGAALGVLFAAMSLRWGPAPRPLSHGQPL